VSQEIIMPALGMAQETGKVLKWLKAQGDLVTKGEPLLEIETDKTTFELEAPGGGILTNVTAAEGDEVPVGSVIAEIRDDRERPAAAVPTSDSGARADSVSVASRGAAVEPAATRPTVSEAASPPLASKQRPGRRLASPKARRIAAERGIDLATVEGSGPEGAVVAQDLAAAGTSSKVKSKPVESLSAAWRLMAERTTQSWTHAPHFYLVREVNASRIIAWREKLRRGSSERITYTDILTKLVAVSLQEHPRVNAEWREDRIELKSQINIGVAVAMEEGLIVPVIHGADKLSVNEIAVRREEVVSRVRGGSLRPDDVVGGTFTISNLGMYGVDAFNAILNPPQAAILAVGRIARRVVAVNDQPAVQPMMIITLSCDHRVIDGARAARFLETLVDLIEEPLGLMR
jgi:pyruvate dehydrogenase E2 component (dihydrolipoamide acetyltransferase)